MVNGVHCTLNLVAACTVAREGFTVIPRQFDRGVEVVGGA